MAAYHRASRMGMRWSGDMTPAIRQLLIANCAVFLVQMLLANLAPNAADTFVRWFGLIPYGVIPGLRLWQPFTYLFLHGGIWHLFWNMLSLWVFGRDLERTWGTRRFWIFYLVAGAGAGLVNVVVKLASDIQVLVKPASEIPGNSPVLVATIGASGAIYGLLMACAILFPTREIQLLFPPVVMTMRMFALVWGALAFFGTLGASGDTISHLTHLSGMAVAYLYLRRGTYLYRLRNQYSDWKQRRLKRKFEVYVRDRKDQPPSKPDQWVQ